MISHVKRYIELGFVVHPCCPPDHRCQSPGKIPFDPIEGKHMVRWQEHEQFVLAQWQEWCDYDSELNLGFLCGSPSGLACIDIDSPEGLVILEQEDIPGRNTTWRYETGRGSRLLYRVSKLTRSYNLSREGHHIEILGDGRQSVLPPSMHPCGRRYRWHEGRSPRDSIHPDSGGWLDGVSPTVDVTSEKEDWERNIQKDTREGGRNETLTRLAGHLMNPCPTPAEEAYIWLSLYNQKHCHPPLPDAELRTIIGSIGRREEAQAAIKKREVVELTKTYGITYSDAEEMWRSMRTVGSTG